MTVSSQSTDLMAFLSFFRTQFLCVFWNSVFVCITVSSPSTDLMAFLSFFPSALDKIKNRNIQSWIVQESKWYIINNALSVHERSPILDLAHAYKMASQQQETVTQTNSRKSLLTPIH